MASAKDRGHFESIARGMDELNRDAARRDGLRPPGQKIEACFELSRLVSSFAASLSRSEEIPPIVLWRKLGRGSKA